LSRMSRPVSDNAANDVPPIATKIANVAITFAYVNRLNLWRIDPPNRTPPSDRATSSPTPCRSFTPAARFETRTATGEGRIPGTCARRRRRGRGRGRGRGRLQRFHWNQCNGLTILAGGPTPTVRSSRLSLANTSEPSSTDGRPQP
jgi:hypothetical protein